MRIEPAGLEERCIIWREPCRSVLTFAFLVDSFDEIGGVGSFSKNTEDTHNNLTMADCPGS